MDGWEVCGDCWKLKAENPEATCMVLKRLVYLNSLWLYAVALSWKISCGRKSRASHLKKGPFNAMHVHAFKCIYPLLKSHCPCHLSQMRSWNKNIYVFFKAKMEFKGITVEKDIPTRLTLQTLLIICNIPLTKKYMLFTHKYSQLIVARAAPVIDTTTAYIGFDEDLFYKLLWIYIAVYSYNDWNVV